MCFRLFSKLRNKTNSNSGTAVTAESSKLNMDSKESFTTGPEDKIIKPHPLLNRLVIVRTFNNLGVDDLKKCREICKNWNKVALDLLPDKTEFDCRKMCAKDIDGALEALAKDLCLLPQNFVYSFNSNFQLTCRKFMKYYGHRIVSLRLRPWETVDVFSREDLVSLLFQCPYLQSISLSAIPDELASGSFLFSRPCPMTGRRDTVFPNMTSLTLYGGSAYSVEFLCDIFTAMPNLSTFIVQQAHGKCLDKIFWLLKNPNYTLPELKIFQIIRPLEFNNDHLIRIELCGFHLKVLNLSRVQKTNNAIGKIYLEPLLQTLAFTLEELTLPAFRAGTDGEVRGYTCQVSFPKMLSLRKLELEDWKLFGPLTFVKNSFPKLTFLAIDDPNERHGEDEVQLAIPDKLTPHLKLNELSLPFYFHDEDALEGILKGFPQLKKLKLYVTDRILGVIYNFGQQLEELHMYLTSLATDTGITGIPKKHCDFLRNDYFRAARKTENNAWKKTKDSIENLPKLQRLTLACAGKMFITDVSLLYGVKHLKNLTNLCLRNCKISDQSLVELLHLPLLHLDLGSLGDCKITQIGLCYFRHNMPYTHLLFTEKSCPNL